MRPVSSPPGLSGILRAIFSIATDSFPCFCCRGEVTVIYRYCPHCGNVNPLHPAFLPALTEEEKEFCRSDCTQQDHKELAAMEPAWTTCHVCGSGLRH